MEFFAAIEQTVISIWVRESTYAFPVILSFHSISMGFLAGLYFALDLRLLGIARGVPLARFSAFKPVVVISFIIIFLSGLLLITAYPAKALTNEVFYFKLLLIIVVFIYHHSLNKKLSACQSTSQAEITHMKIRAVTSMLLWIGVIASGRLLAYTHDILMISGI